MFLKKLFIFLPSMVMILGLRGDWFDDEFWINYWRGRGETPTTPAQERKPCKDTENQKSNPLSNMEILGSKNNGIKGRQYGTGRGRMHHGLDLGASIGTPIYSMFDSKVTFVRNFFNPSVAYQNYAQTYPEYKNRPGSLAEGNMVVLEGSSGGITQRYMHLNSVVVSAGPSTIPSGTLIGDTGSAKSSQSNGPHLHLEGKGNGVRKNPEEFLYREFNVSGKNIRVCFKIFEIKY